MPYRFACPSKKGAVTPIGTSFVTLWPYGTFQSCSASFTIDSPWQHLLHVLDQLCSSHAVSVSLVMAMSAPGITTFANCGDVPGAVDLLGTPHTRLPFTVERRAMTALWSKSTPAQRAELGRHGKQRSGMSNYEP